MAFAALAFALVDLVVGATGAADTFVLEELLVAILHESRQ